MNKKEVEQQIKDFADAMYRMGKDDGYKKGIEDTKAQLQKAYENGYADGNNTNLIDEAYQEGLNDAWECAKKLFDMRIPFEIFGITNDNGRTHVNPLNWFVTMSASEAIRKIKDYEEQQKQADAEIRVGDEVIYKYAAEKEGQKGIVVALYYCDGRRSADIISTNGEVYGGILLEYLHKTGKHYDAIDEVLKELKEG